MSPQLRYFTVSEAEQLIKPITAVFEQAQQTKTLIEQKIDSWRRTHKEINEADEAVLRGQVDFLASQLEEQLAQITNWGCVPKDLDIGLVDFPARIDGKEAYLCWKLGETSISHWHGLTEGVQGRKKLNEDQ